MRKVTTVIIGAGQSGLAISQELTLRGVDHVILERGQVANSWRRERWDGLRLLSPNWMNGLPGQPYSGQDPDGFMSVTDLIGDFDRFVANMDLPILTETPVRSVRIERGRYRVQTSQGVIDCKSVVLATGACALTNRPAFASELPEGIVEITPLTYKRPSDLPEGGVLVVGAAASGMQLARDIQKSGRPVTLAVGSHTRMPRRYRDADIFTWMHLLGLLDMTYDQVDDIARLRRTPSMQLSGAMGGGALDLNALQDLGVEVVGRLAGISAGRALFSGSLANLCASADLKMGRMLSAIDDWVEENGLSDTVDPPYALPATRLPSSPRLSLDLKAERVRSVIWATGFRPDYGFIDLPVFDHKGRIRHDGGVVAPGLYVMGHRFLRRRTSSFIDGARADARELSAHLRACLDGRAEIAA